MFLVIMHAEYKSTHFKVDNRSRQRIISILQLLFLGQEIPSLRLAGEISGENKNLRSSIVNFLRTP